jgi:hypothetical protein
MVGGVAGAIKNSFRAMWSGRRAEYVTVRAVLGGRRAEYVTFRAVLGGRRAEYVGTDHGSAGGRVPLGTLRRKTTFFAASVDFVRVMAVSNGLWFTMSSKCRGIACFGHCQFWARLL